MNKKISLGLAVSLIAIASAVTFIITSFFSLQNFNTKVEDVNEKAKKYNSLQTLDSIVRENYFGEIDEEKLRQGILKGYVEGLSDTGSRYLTPDEYEDVAIENSGKIIGIGISVEQNSGGYMAITEIAEDSPVSETMISVGDVIKEIDGVTVDSENYEQCERLLLGKNGSEMKITVHHRGSDITETFVRRPYDINTIEGFLRGDYGYIKIDSFSENTYVQFLELVNNLSEQGAKGLIFDIRNCHGGIIESLKYCLDPLVPSGAIAVADYGENNTETVVSSESSKMDLPIVVIVNGETAGLSELFAASLRDFSDAVLVGTQTKGEGSVQEIKELEDGSAVILSTGKYRTMNSDTFDSVGLNPDYYIQNSQSEDDDAQYQMAESAMKSKLANMNS